jgi:SAM-dependent methyltransferase
MGARFNRNKPRNWMLSLAYKAVRYFPAPAARKLDFLLDLEWIAWRLAWEQGVRLGLHRAGRNAFLLDALGALERVLDLGSGNGEITAAIAQHAPQVVGIDHDAQNLAKARAAYPGLEFIHADASDYLASGEKFDVLVMSHVLEHLDNPAGILAFARDNFLRTYIEVPDFDATPLNQMRLTRHRNLVYSDNDHVAEFDRVELDALLAAAGLEVVAREHLDGMLRVWAVPHGDGTAAKQS